MVSPMPHKVSLQESKHRAMFEQSPRYDVLLNGQRVGELYFNLTGYVGKLPLPGGRWLQIPEGSLTSYRREIAQINREARADEIHAARLTPYQRLMSEAAPDCDVRHVEAYMRQDCPTLDHLDRESFLALARTAADCVRADPPLAERLAQSMGIAP